MKWLFTMSFPEYEYKGLIAQAWDVLRGDTSDWPDRLFYLDIIKRYGQPVLDVGCGTGRLLLDYLHQGIDIHGVDNSPDMLNLCRHKAAGMGLEPILYEQYVEVLRLPVRFRTILIPSSSLQLIIDPEAVQQTLKQLYSHLLPGGAISASFMTLWKEGKPLEREWEQTALRQEDGVQFRRFSKSQYDPATECIHTQDNYQMIVHNEVVEEENHQRSPATRSYTQAQAKGIFEKAGFRNVFLYSEFTFEPVKPEDRTFVVVANRV